MCIPDVGDIRPHSSAFCRSLWCDLVVPQTRYGPRGFTLSGPVTWSSLPPDLRDTSLPAASFLSQLMTELFIT